MGNIVSCSFCKCCESDESFSSQKPAKHARDTLTTGHISRVELWTLVEYAIQYDEKDKLSDVISSLTRGPSGGTYGSTGNTQYGADPKEEHYQKLVSWKAGCNIRDASQTEAIYKKGFAAGMGKTVKKLQEFRGTVSMVSSIDLEHVLWQIGNESGGNITQLLGALDISPTLQPNAGLKKMIKEALCRLETWQEGYVPINPVAMLSLALEGFQFSQREKDFFQIPQEQKENLKEEEKKKYVYDATIRHCKRTLTVICSEGRGEGVVMNTTLEENAKALFNTYQMVEDWLEGQECSNYKKRSGLLEAINRVKSSEPDTGKDIFSAKDIREKASEIGKVEAAWILLKTDILPFAKALGVDESKLTHYRPPQVQESHYKMGTVGLVSMLVD